ncbi:MAG: cytochrome c maturation protein CcmE [Gammaproteobacteria bacterium]|nr:cytochrome c maturation protein CcmE [Gammaproteobacteria bacterium]
MTPVRRNRIVVISFVFVGAVLTLTTTIFALQDNMQFFYLPDQIVNGEAPEDKRIRAGGMVVAGSIRHDEDQLLVSFELTDMKGSSFPVSYAGILPGLFAEGQGTVVTGTLDSKGVFQADVVLAKHDEQYMPPELDGLHASQ